jgi:hypothetical protein
MKIHHVLATIMLACFATAASADLEPWKDYTVSESVSNVTTVKVDSNMIDKYLEGLRTTWAPTNAIAKELGQIEDYGIYVSQLPNGGEFNVVLVVIMKDAAAMQPSQERYEAFMAKWSEESQKKSEKVVMSYPDIRTITGEYLLREVTFK